jgi:hypothetical protein
MRNRSNAIIAENLNDYISQIKSFGKENKNDIFYKLFDFDLLSLNESKNNINSEENDLLSSKKTYRICLNDIKKKFKNLHKKRILISLKFRKNQKKKRRLIIKSENISIHN